MKPVVAIAEGADSGVIVEMTGAAEIKETEKKKKKKKEEGEVEMVANAIGDESLEDVPFSQLFTYSSTEDRGK